MIKPFLKHKEAIALEVSIVVSQDRNEGVVIGMGIMEGLLGQLAKFCYLIWVIVTRMFSLQQFIELYVCFVYFLHLLIYNKIFFKKQFGGNRLFQGNFKKYYYYLNRDKKGDCIHKTKHGSIKKEHLENKKKGCQKFKTG